MASDTSRWRKPLQLQTYTSRVPVIPIDNHSYRLHFVSASRSHKGVALTPGARRSNPEAMARPSSIPQRPTTRLYLITPPVIDDLEAFAQDLEAALSAGDVAALQLRLKPANDDQIKAACSRLGPIVKAHGVALILNDRPDLAQSLGCDGVHVGLSDASVASARRLMGADAMIGATCHDSRDLAMEAAEAGADYVAFGAFFPTGTKDTTHRPDPEILTIWQETVEVPCVAIGGITPDTAGQLARAGADFIAVSSAVWDHPDGPSEGVKAMNKTLEAAASDF